MTTKRRTLRFWLPLLLIAAVLAASCSDDGDDSSAGDTASSADFGDDAGDDSGDDSDAGGNASDSSGAPQEPADDGDDAEGEAEPGLAVPTALTGADIGRDIVFRATIGVAVADVAAAGREATLIVQSLGGIVFGQSTTVDPSPRTVLTFKILPADFDTALEQLAGVGELVDQTISADDVTDRVVDLESRISTSEASVLRLRGFLENAGDINIIADLERQLLDRETTLETLRGQLRTLRDQVSLATITVTITEKGIETLPAELAVESWLGDDEASACPGSTELATSRDGSAVWCIEIENVGDADLIDLEIESEALRLRTADFTVRSGELALLAPGDRVVAIVELDLDDGRVRRRDARSGLFLDVVASATPGDNPDAEVSARSDAVLLADSDEPLPGFFDAFSGAVTALAIVASILLLALGAALPFSPFALIGVWIWRRNRSRSLPAPPPAPPGSEPTQAEK